MKYCLGPMSKNIVDTVIEYSNKYNKDFIFIPSRRQIEYNGGYVNNWTTRSFSEYIKLNNKNNKILLERDHGGPGQGTIDDDGYDSLKEDVKYMDIIHIDPWKKYNKYEDALKWTIEMINYCYNLNSNILYEVATEEGIRYISVEELEQFMKDLKLKLEEKIYNKIKYVVIQCGTGLEGSNNIGKFNSERLIKMLKLISDIGLIAKEHNGDWVSSNIVNEKEKLGLKYINIAPELGEIETAVIIKEIKENKTDLDILFNLCLQSGKWKKWVNEKYDPYKNKENLILICCHYIFSSDEFLQVKNKYINIDIKIKETIFNKLLELDNIYTTRTTCIFCKNSDLELIYKDDKKSTISYGLEKEKFNGYYIPYNIQKCKKCYTFQIKYLGNINMVYSNNHIDTYGSVKTRMHNEFSNFITKNNNIENIIEIGACTCILSNKILSNTNKKHKINIIDPSFIGNSNELNIINNYIENEDITKIKANTIIMSSVFEHFYEPLNILEKLKKSKNIKYIYLNHPDLEYSIENNLYINLTVEHTFYIENNFLIGLFNKYGFKLKEQLSFENHTIMLQFERTTNIEYNTEIININSNINVTRYLSILNEKVNKINQYIKNNIDKKYYLWPASMHLAPLLINGLQINLIEGMLDNSPNKIGKYFYGYNLKCYSFEEILNKNDDNICIFLGGSTNYKNELKLLNTKCILIDI